MSWLSEVDKARRRKQEQEKTRRKFLDSELRKHDPMVRRVLEEVAEYLKKVEAFKAPTVAVVFQSSNNFQEGSWSVADERECCDIVYLQTMDSPRFRVVYRSGDVFDYAYTHDTTEDELKDALKEVLTWRVSI
ncbi:MAG TPA: hypothetical protein VGL70_07390 [Candidatus Binatia bacterium]|jgi:hypothetical protein